MTDGGDGPILLAGGTGDLGLRIARALVARGAGVRALVRRDADAAPLAATGVAICRVDFADPAALVAATSILNGAFADLLVGQAPIVLRGPRLILHWSSPDQPLDFTTKDDVAAFTAAAALDPQTPRFLRIAGDVVTPRMLAAIMRDL